MLVQLVFGALLADASPPPLHQIGHVKVSLACSTLHQSVAPAIQGIQANDRIIGIGKQLFFIMGKDATQKGDGAAFTLDQLNMERGVSLLVANLAKLDALIATIPVPKGDSSDDRLTAAMRRRLEAVADQQRKAIGIMNGVVDSESLGDLQGAGDDLTKTTMPEEVRGRQLILGSPPPTLGTANINGAGLALTPDEKYSARQLAKESQFGNNPFATSMVNLEIEQRDLSIRERAASAPILEAVAACGGRQAPTP